MAITRNLVVGRIEHQWTLRVRPEDLETWRKAVSEVLGNWRVTRETAELTLQGVMELLVNVHRHVPDPRCRLRLSCGGAELRVAVSDRSARAPRVGLAPDWTAEHGRGLWLLREMADDFGYCSAASGCACGDDGLRMAKTVWFVCRGAFRPAVVA
ncbi:ATP-binding protein [Streptomyces sp. DSM 44915]|uniref:ATP-binding protein n=1 Tax=Streptomyces chisholmiae TaxID=3075540 RepID=A0ABU2JM39_9ACTN|nr:ATP-binding protein [Streptomyces sp. DSM 44915]MDT0265798.1 ATP-binding protein [Streptomyces sp. DSM 44915]